MKTKATTPALGKLERLVEQATGRSVQHIRNQTLEDDRIELERRTGRKLSFPRKFPHVGRGCIMGDRAKTHEEVDRLFEAALK